MTAKTMTTVKKQANRRQRAGVDQRRCTRCGKWFNETNEHFAFNSRKQIFNSWCKPCVRKQQREAKEAKSVGEQS